MPGSSFELRFDVNSFSLFVICVALLIMPLTWILAWIASMAFHEMGHLVVARLLSIPVYGMTVSATGARIETAPMEPVQELLCATAGPFAGCLLILAGRFVPLIAFFAFFHTVWNLLPLGESDGARALRCLWTLLRKIPCKPERERVQ